MATTDWNMKTFMKGASILTISAIAVKLLAAVYRIPFQNLVGDKGFYIYQQVYPFIGIFIIWTSSGFAVAVSKMLAGSTDAGEEKAVKRIALAYLSALSVMFFALLMLFAPHIAAAMGDPSLVSLLRAGAGIVLIMPLLSVLKGTFQSEGQMVPVAVSNVSEQAVRVAVILAGTFVAVRAGASLYTAGEVAMWGAVIGQAFGVVILALYYRQDRTETPIAHVPVWRTVKELTLVSVSVSFSSLILLLYQLSDSFTVFNLLLAKGMMAEAAMEMKGVYDRGQPLVQMGILIASTLSLAIVPLIAHHSAKKEGRSAAPFISLTFRTAFLFGLAAAVGLALVLPFLNEMLFETRDGSAALIVFSFQVFWLSLILPLTAILAGAGKVKIPALLLIAGLVVKTAANILLIPVYDVAGASIAGNIGFAFTAAGLLLYVKKVLPVRLAPLRFYGWLAVAASGMAAAVILWSIAADRFLFAGLPSRAGATVIATTAAAAGAGVFLLIVMKSRIMAEKEWYLLPFGKRLARVQVMLTRNRR